MDSTLKITNIKDLSVDERKLLFDQLESFESVPFTQAPWYTIWHETLGRDSVKVAVVDSNSKLFAYMQIVECQLPFGKKFYYAPYGPVIMDQAEEVILLLKKWLKKFVKETGAIFVRIDVSPEKHQKFLDVKFKKVPRCAEKGSIIQPRVEWQINLEKDREVLFSEIDKKTRYDIRQAEEKNVIVFTGKDETRALGKTFYNLIKETAKRNNFHLHPENYYKAVFETIDREDAGYVVVGMIEAEIVAMHVMVTYGDTVMYAFGGTLDAHRNIPSSHLLQWKSIQHAKELGYKFYNMGGVSSDTRHEPSLLDVTRFKRRFGGNELIHADLYDQVGNPLWYYLYILRKWISCLFKKK